MNFDFSSEEKNLKSELRALLQDMGGPASARRVMDDDALLDRPLWQELGRLGWLSAAIPESYGGQGLAYSSLCAIAEELGRSLAAVPVSSSLYLAAEALLLAGSDTQKARWLPALGSGETIGTLALVEGAGAIGAAHIKASVANGKLTGSKFASDGMVADIAVVAATEGDETGLYLVELNGQGVRRQSCNSLDQSRPLARLDFDAAPAEPLGSGWPLIERLLARTAVLTAFEQVGGADACLEMARGYALERWAFGRPIAQYQAVKHRIVDIYVANELARSNAYYGAWALDSAPDLLPRAAAMARLSAVEAYERAARDNIQTHAAIAATWEHDAHLHYRRSRHLALSLGTSLYWQDRLALELGNDTNNESH
ncbi:MAG: acyl-CoA dehydrogenase family protein [Porticoccaceae bacterium]